MHLSMRHVIWRPIVQGSDGVKIDLAEACHWFDKATLVYPACAMPQCHPHYPPGQGSRPPGIFLSLWMHEEERYPERGQ